MGSVRNATQDNKNGIRTIPKESIVPHGNLRQQTAQLRHQTENLKNLNHGPADNAFLPEPSLTQSMQADRLANDAKKPWDRFGIFGNTTSILDFTPASRSRRRIEFLRNDLAEMPAVNRLTQRP